MKRLVSRFIALGVMIGIIYLCGTTISSTFGCENIEPISTITVTCNEMQSELGHCQLGERVVFEEYPWYSNFCPDFNDKSSNLEGSSTKTPVPTYTFLPTSTSTSKPTATKIPPTATAIPMGAPAINDDYEVTVLYARYFSKIQSGAVTYISPDGGKFLDLAVVVKNLQPDKKRNIPWENIYIVDNNQEWYPNFGGSFASNNNDEFDPLTLYLFPYDDLDNLIFEDYPLYIRAVWATDGQRPGTFLFGFDTSNLVEVVIP
jgi:hypothetical protein